MFLPRARRRTACGLFLKSLTKPPRRGMMKKSNPVPPREVDVMTREEAMEIIKKENLKYYNLFGQHPVSYTHLGKKQARPAGRACFLSADAVLGCAF